MGTRSGSPGGVAAIARVLAVLGVLTMLGVLWLKPPVASPEIALTLLATIALGSGCGLLSTVLLARGVAAAYIAGWLAIGALLAVAIPTLMTIGVLCIAAAALIALDLVGMPNRSGHPWWHPRYAGAGLLLFTVLLWAIFLLTLPRR